MNPSPWNARIAVLGAGDRGTAAALKLFRSGFQPVVIESTHPADLHFNRNFSDAVYSGKKTVDDVPSQTIPADPYPEVENGLENSRANRILPVLSIPLDRQQHLLTAMKSEIVVDCTRRRPGSADLDWTEFACVIRIGFNYQVGTDGHFVIGDLRPYCGLVYQSRHEIQARDAEDDAVYKAPIEGVFLTEKRIGDTVSEREVLGTINTINILAPFAGILGGLLHSGHYVRAGHPLFELLPGRKSIDAGLLLPVRCRTIAGGILEAVLNYLSRRTR